MNKSSDEILNQYLDDNSIDENIVIAKLLKSSDKFKKFYENEIKNENVKRHWIDNKILRHDDPLLPLPYGVLATGLKLYVNEWVICVRNVPSFLTDETVIAHELAHLKIDCEGFPLTTIDPTYCNNEEMAFFLTSLNNMIHDPLVIMKLKSYGYDLRREYIRECQEGIKILQNTNGQPTGITEAKFVFDYVKNTLENQILFGEKNTACKRYLEIFGQKFGSVKLKGDELLKMISEIGFGSPDNVHRIYVTVIEKCGLSNFIYLEH
jgi:hypothetical protein